MRLRTRLPDFNSRKGAENPTDIESRACHQGEASSALSTEKLRYLGLVFNLPEDTIRKYHGVHAYCHYIESSFGPLLEDQYAPVWDVFGMPQPRSTPDCWLLPIAVLVSLKSRTKAATIDSVLDSLMSDHGTATLRNRAFPQIAVFAVLCWATMILTPSLQPGVQQPHLACKLPGRRDTDGAVQHKLHGCKRAISVALREFKSQAWGAHVMRVGQHDDEAKRAGQQNLEENEDLYEATLNYSSLQLFGKIRIQWVTTMTAHLDFDPASRCLSLYRFPSVCALKAAQGDESISPVFKRYARSQRLCPWAHHETPFADEVLRTAFLKTLTLYGLTTPYIATSGLNKKSYSRTGFFLARAPHPERLRRDNSLC